MFGNSTIETAKNLNLVTPFLWFLGIMFLFLLMWIYDQLWGDISVMPFGIIGFFGNQGRGKTFTAVTYARRFRHKHPHTPVYTNMYKLELPGDGPVYLDCDLDKMMEAEDSLILIDEAGVFVNSWEWMSGAQRKFAQFAAGTRHLGNLILVTAHTPEQLNIRMQKVLAELHFMESFQGIGVFRSYVYESFAGTRKNNRTKTQWVPKWPSTCRSYDTQMLRKHLKSLQGKTGLSENELAIAAAAYDENGNPIGNEGVAAAIASSGATKKETTTKSRGQSTSRTSRSRTTEDREPDATTEHIHNPDCAEWRVIYRQSERDRRQIAKRNAALALREKMIQKAS